jgi:hypothetical protein
LVSIVLKAFCKSYETNGKTEKKNKRTKKVKEAAVNQSGPGPDRAHNPAPLIPEAVWARLLFDADRLTPPVRVVSKLGSEL